MQNWASSPPVTLIIPFTVLFEQASPRVSQMHNHTFADITCSMYKAAIKRNKKAMNK